MFSLCVYFGLLCPSYRHLEAKEKSHFKFLDWILKLVWDLFPYAIVALMFAAFLVMNGSIVVGRFTHWCEQRVVNMRVGCVRWKESRVICILAVSCDVYSLYCTLHS